MPVDDCIEYMAVEMRLYDLNNPEKTWRDLARVAYMALKMYEIKTPMNREINE